MAGESTWTKDVADVEFEENPRTVGPFAAVIKEYQKHGLKQFNRKKKTANTSKAALYYFGTVAELQLLQPGFPA